MVDTTSLPPLSTFPRLPLDKSQFTLSQDKLSLFKLQTGIGNEDELIAHILKKRHIIYMHILASITSHSRSNYWHTPDTIKCLRMSKFLQYTELLRMGEECPDVIFVDVGCCFGTDVRKAVVDGFPLHNIVATDLNSEFWEMGHKLFKSTPATFPVVFLPGDIFDPNHLEAISPLTSKPTALAPPLSSLQSLNPLRGHVSVIHTSMLFHLFDESAQLQLARSLAGLLSPEPGPFIFGWQYGLKEQGTLVGLAPDSSRVAMVCHSPESWENMWNGIVFHKGMINVKAKLIELWHRNFIDTINGSSFWWLEWSVTRV